MPLIDEIKNKIKLLLIKTEKFTGTDMVYLTKGGFWLLLAQFFSLSSSFILTIAFANLLTVETYGVFKYILSISGILVITTLNGMGSAVIQATAKGYEGSLTRTIKPKIYWGILGTLLGVILSIYYYINGNIILGTAVLIMSIFVPFIETFLNYNYFLSGKKLFRESSRYGNFSNIITTVVIIATTIVTKNLYFIVLIYFLSQTLVRFYFYLQTIKNYQSNTNFDSGTMSYGKHLSVMNILSTVALYLDKLLVFHLLGASMLAVYIMALAPIEQLRGTVKIFGTLALPKFSQNDFEITKKTIFQKIFKLDLLMLLVAVIYTLVCPYFYHLVFPQYSLSIFYSQLLSFSLVLSSPVIILNNLLQSQQKTKELYSFNIYTSVFQITALVILGYLFGIYGIIASRFASNFFNLLYSRRLIKK